jgi:hypothetical protein
LLPNIRIEKELWLKDTFAKCRTFADVLREPNEQFGNLTKDQKDKIRQTQVEAEEVIRILGFYEAFALIMKWDKVIGWLPKDSFTIDKSICELGAPQSLKLTPLKFFEYWAGVQYVWGGVTQAGIDCSGLTQRYFLDVHDKQIAKNSKDQRKSGQSKNLASITDHDLVCCTRIGGKGIHHVGVFYQGSVWHAQLENGVICQDLNEFLKLYTVEEVVSLIS